VRYDLSEKFGDDSCMQMLACTMCSAGAELT
jgi:hypothetical protein